MSRAGVVGERFGRRITLSRASIRAFARMAGDGNPIHHDEELAAKTRLGGIVASGPQMSSLLMGLTATRFSCGAGMLGLDFRFRFRRPARPDQELHLWWEIVAIHPKESLRGELVLLAGQAVDEQGTPLVKAVGKVLVVPEL